MLPESKIRESRLYSKVENLNDTFFSLSTYYNNYLISENVENVMSFYDQFETREDLIDWMRNRPKGISKLYEFNGNKEIIIVITTADINGKFAKECRDNIFLGLHIIFVESGGKDDFLFNIAHNINVGLKEALKYNPKWIFFSSDDVYRIDSVQKLIDELEKIDFEKYDFVTLPPTSYHSQTTAIARRIKATYIIYIILKYRGLGLSRLRIEEKFNVEYNRFPVKGISKLIGKLFYKMKTIIIENGDVAIFSSKYVKSLDGTVYDETFINAYEETELALRVNTNPERIANISYQIGDYIGSTLGVGTRRTMHDIIGAIYFNKKWYGTLETL